MEGFTNNWPISCDGGQMLHMDMVIDLHDCGFEPQTRARSNTWPCPPTENFIETSDELDSTKTSNQQLTSLDPQPVIANINANSKKNSSRRNAWGNLSYADLITRAIGSAVDKRLTLSQIYEWMVANVPFFKDKGDSNSSAGWKNSIRHNLSLHNRFMRVQNEGTGKSSWWMLNPDAKPGKSVRRRAASMETSRYEKRRGRAKKRAEVLRQSGITGLNGNTPSPGSSISEGLDRFSDSPLHSSYPISPDFRQRASSNASSCGRLSPRPTLDWNFSADYSSISAVQSKTLDQLAGTIAEELKLQQDLMQQGFNQPMGMTPQAPPPPYPSNHLHQHQNPLHKEQYNQQQRLNYGPNSTGLVTSYTSLSRQACMFHRSLLCACTRTNRDGFSPNSITTMSPTYPNSEPSSDSLNTCNNIIMDGYTALPPHTSSLSMIRHHQQQQQRLQQLQQRQVPHQHQANQQQQAHKQQQAHQQQQQNHPSEIMDRNVEGNDGASTLIGQCMEALNSETSIIEFNIDNFQGGLECNIEELIRHEMSIDGRLDFNIPLAAVNSNQNIQAVGENGVNFIDTSCDPLTTTSAIHHQHINQLQLQPSQQQETQSHNELPSMLNNIGLELSATQTASANLNVHVKYTQTNPVTTPSFVH